MHPYEVPHLLLAFTLHTVAILLRSTQPMEQREGDFNLRKSARSAHGWWRNHQGLLFRFALACSWVYDFTCFLHLTPMYVVGVCSFGVRGQTFGMYVFGIQCVNDSAEHHDHRRTPQFSSACKLIVRQVINHLGFLVTPLTMIYPGKTLGAVVTGTTLVLRPLPCSNKGPHSQPTWTPKPHSDPANRSAGHELSIVERLVPFAVTAGAYTMVAVLLSGQGLNGKVLFGKLWCFSHQGCIRDADTRDATRDVILQVYRDGDLWGGPVGV